MSGKRYITLIFYVISINICFFDPSMIPSVMASEECLEKWKAELIRRADFTRRMMDIVRKNAMAGSSTASGPSGMNPEMDPNSPMNSPMMTPEAYNEAWKNETMRRAAFTKTMLDEARKHAMSKSSSTPMATSMNIPPDPPMSLPMNPSTYPAMNSSMNTPWNSPMNPSWNSPINLPWNSPMNPANINPMSSAMNHAMNARTQHPMGPAMNSGKNTETHSALATGMNPVMNNPMNPDTYPGMSAEEWERENKRILNVMDTQATLAREQWMTMMQIHNENLEKQQTHAKSAMDTHIESSAAAMKRIDPSTT